MTNTTKFLVFGMISLSAARGQEFMVTGSYTHPSDSVYPQVGSPYWSFQSAGSVFAHGNAGVANGTPDGAQKIVVAFSNGGAQFVYAVQKHHVVLYQVNGGNWVQKAAVNCGCATTLAVSADGRTVWAMGMPVNTYGAVYSPQEVHRFDFTFAFTNSGPPPSKVNTVNISTAIGSPQGACTMSLAVNQNGKSLYTKCFPTWASPYPAQWNIVTLDATTLNPAGPGFLLPSSPINNFFAGGVHIAPNGQYLLLSRYRNTPGTGSVVKVALSATGAPTGWKVLNLQYPTAIAMDPTNPNRAYINQAKTLGLQELDTGSMTLLGPVSPPSMSGTGGCALAPNMQFSDFEVSPITGNLYGYAATNQLGYRNAVVEYILSGANKQVRCHFDASGDYGGGRSISISRPTASDCFGGPVGTICTIAGTGTSGYSPDGSPAKTSAVNAWTMVHDSRTQSLLFAETERIRGLELSSGKLFTLAGSGVAGYLEGPPLSAKVQYVSGIAPHPLQGIVYFSMANAYGIIRQMNAAGTSLVAGDPLVNYLSVDGPGLSAKMNWPVSLVRTLAGAHYFLEAQNRKLKRLDGNNVVSTICTFPPLPGGGWVNSVVLGGGGDFFLHEGNISNARIFRTTVNATGCSAPVVVATGSVFPAMVFDALKNRLIFAGQNRVLAVSNVSSPASTFATPTVIAGTGAFGDSGDGGPATAAQLKDVNSMALDQAGNIYMSTQSRIRVVKQ